MNCNPGCVFASDTAVLNWIKAILVNDLPPDKSFVVSSLFTNEELYNVQIHDGDVRIQGDRDGDAIRLSIIPWTLDPGCPQGAERFSATTITTIYYCVAESTLPLRDWILDSVLPQTLEEVGKPGERIIMFRPWK